MADNTAPEHIWLQTGGCFEGAYCPVPDGGTEVTWSPDRVDDDDQEYVRADIYEAAIARAEEIKQILMMALNRELESDDD